MTRKTKTFDCVEMKNRIQAERLAEYEARKDEFSSYLDFINARVEDSELARIVPQRMAATQAAEDLNPYTSAPLPPPTPGRKR